MCGADSLPQNGEQIEVTAEKYNQFNDLIQMARPHPSPVLCVATAAAQNCLVITRPPTVTNRLETESLQHKIHIYKKTNNLVTVTAFHLSLELNDSGAITHNSCLCVAIWTYVSSVTFPGHTCVCVCVYVCKSLWPDETKAILHSQRSQRRECSQGNRHGN